MDGRSGSGSYAVMRYAWLIVLLLCSLTFGQGTITSLPEIATEDLTDSQIFFGLDNTGDNTSYKLSLESLKETGVQVVNVKQHGATGDGVTDDTTAIAAALTAASGGGIVFLPPGSYLVSTTLTIATDGTILMGAGRNRSKITTANGWSDVPVVNVTGDNCGIADLAIIEASADPTDSAKSGANNVGIDVNGADCTIERIEVDGFGYTLVNRNNAADTSVDGLTVRQFLGHNAYSYGVEIDSAKRVRLYDVTSHDNGLDGIKIQNEYDVTCEGLLLVGCESYSNGQRDIAAGGAENTNGNGIDVFQGGYRFRLMGCRAHSNYGSGFVIKNGGGGSIPIQGEGMIIGCQFDNNLTLNTGAGQLGADINTSFATGGSVLQFIGCSFSGNDGSGAMVGGGFGVRFVNCNFIRNKKNGLLSQKGRDISLSGCNLYGNLEYGAILGISNTGAFDSKRINFRDCSFSGAYDPYMAASSDQWDAATTAQTFTADNTTETITAAEHGLSNGDAVRIYTVGGTLPTGLATSTTYWIINAATDTFEVSTTKGGSAVDITADGSGNNYFTQDGEVAIRAYSDSADIAIDGCSFANFWSPNGTVYCSADRTVIEKSRFFDCVSIAVRVAHGKTAIRDCHIKEMNWGTSATQGAIRVAASAELDNISLVQSSSTGSTVALRFDSTATDSKWNEISTTNYAGFATVTAGATFSTDWAQQTIGTAAPSTGYWIAGAIAFNSAPASASPEYWRCVTAGEPGTWEAGPNHP